MQRVELDAPVVASRAERWQATRPGADPIPTWTTAAVVGADHHHGWSIDGIDLALPSLAPGKPVRARISGRYLAPPSRVPFDLEVTMSAPRSGTDLLASGSIDIQRAGWSLPGHVSLSGPLWLEDGGLRMAPAKLGLSGATAASSTRPRLVHSGNFIRGWPGLMDRPAVLDGSGCSGCHASARGVGRRRRCTWTGRCTWTDAGRAAVAAVGVAGATGV